MESSRLYFKELFSEEIVNSARNILSTYFDELTDFFLNEFFNYSVSKCTFLVTRRCFLLAGWFLNYLSIRDDIAKKYIISIDTNYLCIKERESNKINYIVTDKCFSILKNNKVIESIKEIVLLDDICIHGRQLLKSKKNITDIINNKDIKILRHAFMLSEDTIAHNIDYWYRVSNNAKWTLLSQKIVEFINFLNLPYVSYINSLLSFNVSDLEHEEILNTLSQNANITISEFGNDTRQNLGKLSYFIVEKDVNKLDYEYVKCLRYYYNFETHTSLMIPYVILDSLNDLIVDDNNILKLIEQYLNPQSSKELLTIIKSYNLSKDIFYGFMYNLVSCIASQAYSLYFMRKYLSIKDYIYDVGNCILMTFGNDIADIVLDRKNYVEQDANLIESVLALPEKNEYITEYCGIRWSSREISVLFNEEDPDKLTIDKLLTRINQGKKLTDANSKYAYFRDIIDLCDFGRLSISSKNDDANSFLEAGELGFLAAREAKKISKNSELVSNLAKLLNYRYYRFILI